MKITRERGDVLRVRLEPHEATTLAALVRDLLTVLEPGGLETVDPVYQRLFPAGYPDDPDAARAFRELTESALGTDRRARAEQVVADLDGARPGRRHALVDLDRDGADRWLKVLNDLRLAIGTRLDITEDDRPPEFDPNGADAMSYAVYSYLTAVQDLLVRSLTD